MRVDVKLNMANINGIERKIQSSLKKTGEAVHEDLLHSRTMPFDSGNLQNDSTFVDTSKVRDGEVFVVSDTPYARRLYFHPEYNFSTDENDNAGAEWFEPYISGKKKDFALKVFARFMGGL
ncbi:MAG: hypothetical protein U0K91_03635 [Acutalibacteraceae bacterium]|nr:hypothetical protein [Acutalibacteraceae bacterium]